MEGDGNRDGGKGKEVKEENLDGPEAIMVGPWKEADTKKVGKKKEVEDCGDRRERR